MTTATEATGWHAQAEALAAFVVAHLPNRTDVWGGYLPPAHRVPDRAVTYTAPAILRRGSVTLTGARLIRHFRATDGGDTIGLHTTSPDDTSRWFGLDFDVHEEDADGADLTTHRLRVDEAVAWCVDALGERCALLLEDSNGNGGRHLWARFDAPVSTPALFVLLATTADACEQATGYRPETYPKQPNRPRKKDGAPQLGNWLRLPGLHHTRPHWSRLARPGDAWQSGADAAALLLAWPATPANAVPPLSAYPKPAAPPASSGVPYRRPGETLERPSQRADRIARYVDKLPHGTAGTGRSDHCYRLACFLRYDMGCTDAEALGVLHAWNCGNMPPLPEWKVAETWENAATYGGRRAA